MIIYAFAGPNGSGKSTLIDNFVNINNLDKMPFINADNIANIYFSNIQDYEERNLTAAKFATQLREFYVEKEKDFIFETVLSTPRNLELLNKAKCKGYNIIGAYVLTRDPQINIQRVKSRVAAGGHDVPINKIVSRYSKCLDLLPEFVDVTDCMLLYDNTANYILTLIKNNNDIVVFSDDIQNDVWLQTNIIEPLKNKYKIKYSKSLNVTNEDIFNLKTMVENAVNNLKTQKI